MYVSLEMQELNIGIIRAFHVTKQNLQINFVAEVSLLLNEEWEFKSIFVAGCVFAHNYV